MLRQKLRLTPDGCEESKLFQYSWRKPSDGPAESLNAAVEHFEGFSDFGLGFLAAGVTQKQLQLEAQNHQRLPGFIVQLAADASAFFLLRF